MRIIYEKIVVILEMLILLFDFNAIYFLDSKQRIIYLITNIKEKIDLKEKLYIVILVVSYYFI